MSQAMQRNKTGKHATGRIKRTQQRRSRRSWTPSFAASANESPAGSSTSPRTSITPGVRAVQSEMTSRRSCFLSARTRLGCMFSQKLITYRHAMSIC